MNIEIKSLSVNFSFLIELFMFDLFIRKTKVY